MGMTDIHGGFQRVANNKNATLATVVMDCAGYNSVMLLHTRTSGTGYSTVRMRKFTNGAYSDWGVHSAPSGNSDWGLNVKTAGGSVSHMTVFRGITPQVGIALVRTSGTHSLDVLFLNT